jgi:hypothetical protein
VRFWRLHRAFIHLEDYQQGLDLAVVIRIRRKRNWHKPRCARYGVLSTNITNLECESECNRGSEHCIKINLLLLQRGCGIASCSGGVVVVYKALHHQIEADIIHRVAIRRLVLKDLEDRSP